MADTRRGDVLFITSSSADAQRFEETADDLGSEITLHVVTDVDAARAFIDRRDQYADAPRPDIVVLNLQVHDSEGVEFVSSLKRDPARRQIPTIVLTGSDPPVEVLQLYKHHANACVRKPDGATGWDDVVRTLVNFWLNIAELPPKE